MTTLASMEISLRRAEAVLFDEYKRAEREVWSCGDCANDTCEKHPARLDTLSAALLDVRVGLGNVPPDPAGLRASRRGAFIPLDDIAGELHR